MSRISHQATHLAAIAALALFASPALAQGTPPPAVSVTGEAQLSVAPGW